MRCSYAVASERQCTTQSAATIIGQLFVRKLQAIARRKSERSQAGQRRHSAPFGACTRYFYPVLSGCVRLSRRRASADDLYMTSARTIVTTPTLLYLWHCFWHIKTALNQAEISAILQSNFGIIKSVSCLYTCLEWKCTQYVNDVFNGKRKQVKLLRWFLGGYKQEKNLSN